MGIQRKGFWIGWRQGTSAQLLTAALREGRQGRLADIFFLLGPGGGFSS